LWYLNKTNKQETMMKKLLIALTILAVASVAQAELLATWSTADNSGAVVDGSDGATVSALSLYNNAGATGSSSVWGMNNMTDGGGLQFTVSSITFGAGTGRIVDGVIAGSYTGSGTGPNVLNWYVGSTLVDTIDRGMTSGGTFGTGTGGDLGTINSGDVVSLRADLTGGTVRSGTVETYSNSGGSFYMNGPMTLDGTITAIPEPATMSLLGLGALAMVLRRKIRK
jgi:hypothetical protein